MTDRSTRYDNLDGLRVVAAFGIVWHHADASPLRDIAYAGLPIFLILSTALLARKPTPEPWQPYLQKRSHRFLYPWLFWSGFYWIWLLYQLGKGKLSPQELQPWAALTGPSIHLWYLSFMFGVTLLVWFALKSTQGISNRLLINLAVVLFGALLGLKFWIAHHVLLLDSPYKEWLNAFPAIWIGFAWGRCLQADKPKTKALTALLAGAIAVCLLFVVAWHDPLALAYAIALILLYAAFTLPNLRITPFSSLAPLMLGVYVMHPFVQNVVLYRITSKLPLVCSVTLAFIACCAITFALQRVPWVRRFV